MRWSFTKISIFFYVLCLGYCSEIRILKASLGLLLPQEITNVHQEEHMQKKAKIGVFSPNDPRSWVRSRNLELILHQESVLIDALQSKGFDVIRGGEGFSKEDQIAWNTELVRSHITNIAKKSPDVLIINQTDWTFPYDSVDAVKTFMQETNDIARVVIFAYKDPKVPGLVAGMAVGGGLKRIGVPFQLCYGVIDKDPGVIEELVSILEFYKKCSEAAKNVKRAIRLLGRQKYLSLGGMSLRMSTTTCDIDQWQKLFGVSYEALDQSEMRIRALEMVRWKGKPGESDYEEIRDERIKKAIDYLYKEKHGHFDFSRSSLSSLNKFIYQLCFYYATLDLCKEYQITFAGIKCQDELSSRDCTACLATTFLSNDVAPDGNPKEIIPVACENDNDSALTQLWMYLLTGKPAGFGDFRDVADGILTISNCGQHPPYFFGPPGADSVKKLSSVEYMGQEGYYAAGGSSVRGRTPGGQTMTIARLGRENLRYQLVATTIETIEIPLEEHKKYSLAWPLIKGKITIPERTLVNVWPCNHLGFAYGDLTPSLLEMAHRLDIGYRIFDKNGREYFKSS